MTDPYPGHDPYQPPRGPTFLPPAGSWLPPSPVQDMTPSPGIDAPGAPAGFGAPPAPAWNYGPPAGPLATPGPVEASGPAPVGKVVERAHPLTPVVRGWVALVAVGWALLQEQVPGRNAGTRDLPWWVVAAMIGAVALVGGAAGLLSWRFTKFIADETELRVESGWITRRSRRISYSRLQSVDVMQPLAARVLGLAEIRIDAGARDSTTLRYLSRRRAYELRDYLMLRAHGAQTSVEAAKAQTSDPWFADVAPTDRTVVTVPPHELLLGALVSHDLLALVLWAVAPGVLVWLMLRHFGDAVDLVLLFASGVPLLLAIGQYFARRVMAQFNFTLAQTRAGLRITRGLTNLTSQTVPVPRIQSVRISQSLFWRPLRRYRVDLEVLGLGEQTSRESSSKVSTILLPIGTKAQVDAALAAVWPGLRLDAIRYVPSPLRARLLDPLAYGWNAYGLDEAVVVTRRGWLTRHQSVVPHARLQSVAARQGPVERLLGLADVTFHTTGLLHTHAVIHMDAAVARTLVYDEADRAMTSRSAELLA